MTEPAAIDIRGLRKEYGSRVALRGLDLSVRPGEVFGFLGPNGAGKTTTIKILTGLVSATAGSATIFGMPASDAAARRRIGYLPENFRFHDWLTGKELLEFHGRLAGLPAAARKARIPEVLALVGLSDRGNDRLRGYSKGMTQRIGIAQALIHRPDLVLLDEPTSALDPLGRREVRDIIRLLRDEGVTVFLNSHLLGEVEQVCDRLAIVDRGAVVWSGRLGDIARQSQIRLTVDRIDERLFGTIGTFGVAERTDERSLVLEVEDVDVAPKVAAALIQCGYELFELTPTQRSLEDVFVGLVSGSGE